MGEVIVKRDTPHQCFARLRLANGDQIMISVAQSGVKVLKMKWAGMFPASTLWSSGSIAEVAEKFFDETDPLQRPLDSMIDALIDCRSAAAVVVRLSAKLDDVFSQYAAMLEKSDKTVIQDASELPYSKDLIKWALRQFMRKVGETDKKTLDALEVAYVSLSNFQPLTKEERGAVLIMERLGGATADEALESVKQAGDVYCAVLSRLHAEGAALLDELRSLHKGAARQKSPPREELN